MLTRHGMCVKPNSTGQVTDGIKVGKLVLSCISCLHWHRPFLFTIQGSANNKKAMDWWGYNYLKNTKRTFIHWRFERRPMSWKL